MKTCIQLLDQLISCMEDLLKNTKSGEITNVDAIRRAGMEYDQIREERKLLDA
jgi:predicted ATPase